MQSYPPTAEFYARPPVKNFSRSDPAESLEALLGFLRQDFPEYHVFRGQTRDFGRLLPSDFRRFDLGPGVLPHVHRIDQDAYLARGDDIYTARRLGREFFRQLNVVMTNLPLGNILSQQYGLTSQTLDFTRSLEVAAFFATRDWPHYSGRQSTDECGVIYRLKQPKVEISNDLMERMHQRVGAKLVDYDAWVWFDEFIPSWSHDGAAAIFSENGLVAAPKTARLSAPAICLTDTFLVANLKRQLSRALHLAEEHLLGSLGGTTERDFHEFGTRILRLAKRDFHSRLQAQRACLLVAPSWHEVFVPLPYFALPTDNPRVRLARPALAVGKEWLGIEDLVQFPETEVFYFRHTSEVFQSTLSPQALWPNEGDPIFDFYRWLFALSAAKGAIDSRVTFDDKETGIFDRGYY